MKPFVIPMILLLPLACAPDSGMPPEQQSSAPDAESENPYVAEAERRLHELETEVADIKEAVADRATDASEDLSELLAALDRKREGAVEQIAELRDSTGDAWDSMSSRVEDSLDELEGAVSEAWKRIRA